MRVRSHPPFLFRGLLNGCRADAITSSGRLHVVTKARGSHLHFRVATHLSSDHEKNGHDVGLIRLPLSPFLLSRWIPRVARPQTKLLARESTFRRKESFSRRASSMPPRYALQTFLINQRSDPNLSHAPFYWYSMNGEFHVSLVCEVGFYGNLKKGTAGAAVYIHT